MTQTELDSSPANKPTILNATMVYTFLVKRFATYGEPENHNFEPRKDTKQNLQCFHSKRKQWVDK